MKLLFLCPYWGSEARGLAAFLERARAAGYDGVELPLPDEEAARRAALEILAASGLPWVGQHHQTHDADFEAHRHAFGRRLEALAAARPLLVVSQTGLDHFAFEQNAELIGLAGEVGRRHGVPVVHETHRGRFSFAAHVTRSYLEALPGLRLALDASHWCAVAESLLEDQPEAVRLALERTDHVHARVGFPEGPQVTDPRAPEHAEALRCHLAWWERVIDLHRRAGSPRLTITPEFGPVPYMTLLPFSETPVADAWELNAHMMALLRARHGALAAR